MRNRILSAMCVLFVSAFGCEDKVGATPSEVEAAISAHAAEADAHHAKTTSASELTSGTLDPARLPPAVTSQLANHTTRLITAEDALATHGASINALTTDVADHESTLATHATTLGTHQTTLEGHTAALAGQDGAIGNLDLRLDTAEGNIAAHATSLAGLQTQVTQKGLIAKTVLNVSCPSSVSYTTTFSKIANLGSFTKQLAGSTVAITFNGRIHLSGVTTGSGARFELRVDDVATTNGVARGRVYFTEAGGGGVPVSITGIFTGLGAGTRTVSMWVGGNGNGTGAMYDPGCWSTDHLVIEELN